jgi:4-hydroxy-2-oxoheptanedioate aldolase
MNKLYKHIVILTLLFILANIGFAQDPNYKPKQINKCIELLKDGQPIYYINATGGYEEGKKLAKTWADYIMYNMEHHPLDFQDLHEFMRGLVDGGPTPSGHRTPTVIVSLPLLGLNGDVVEAGAWMYEQALAQGVHGVELARARNPEAVKKLLQAIRYPIHHQAIKVLGSGYRGYGSQKFAAWVWGVDDTTYLKKADVWPLNPDGEIMVGVKIEDTVALRNCAKTLKVPGICFAEHGPRDMGLTYGHLEGRADPPIPPEVVAAGEKVLAECKKDDLFFLNNVLPDNVIESIKTGVMICAGGKKESAEIGRKYSKRKMPW